jgi:hypothetical protein
MSSGLYLPRSVVLSAFPDGARLGSETDVFIEARDRNGVRIVPGIPPQARCSWCGWFFLTLGTDGGAGFNVTIDLHAPDGRSLPATLTSDGRDNGVIVISFVPDAEGIFVLRVSAAGTMNELFVDISAFAGGTSAMP